MSEGTSALPFWRSTLRTFKMVAWSFFGIRKRSEFHQDAMQVKPVHLVLVGVVSGICFVVGLIVVVNLIV